MDILHLDLLCDSVSVSSLIQDSDTDNILHLDIVQDPDSSVCTTSSPDPLTADSLSLDPIEHDVFYIYANADPSDSSFDLDQVIFH